MGINNYNPKKIKRLKRNAVFGGLSFAYDSFSSIHILTRYQPQKINSFGKRAQIKYDLRQCE